VIPALQIGLDRETAALDAAVERRVDRMLADGLVEEVERLVELGLQEGRTASRALGYAQVLDALAAEAAGRGTREDLLGGARDATVAATRRFVRRQRSWFRRDPRITWLDADDPDLVERARDVVRRARATDRPTGAT
jgi:tRNA dimethylallyltransferase